MATDDLERYPMKASRYSSHSQIVDLCGRGDGRRLLDVGCARGGLSTALVSAGWSVVGIEPDPADASAARASGVEVIEAGAEESLAQVDGTFDAIVFADVLEHMPHPDAVLRLARGALNPGGKIVISVPNVAHLTVRAQLAVGRFEYADRGIMDRTHLKFFTGRSLRRLVTEAGLTVTEIRVTPAPIEEVFPAVARRPALRPLLAMNAALSRAWKSGLAYQYIVVAVA